MLATWSPWLSSQRGGNKTLGHTSFLKSRQVCQRFFFRIPGGSRTAHSGSCSQPAASLPLSAPPPTLSPHFPVQRIFRLPRHRSRIRGALWCSSFGFYAAPLDATPSGCLTHCVHRIYCADKQHGFPPHTHPSFPLVHSFCAYWTEAYSEMVSKHQKSKSTKIFPAGRACVVVCVSIRVSTKPPNVTL